jgi:hypothetical protein
VLLLSAAEAARLQARVGQDLNGRYVMLASLGQGAFAWVWKARDQATGEVVAIKQFRPRGTSPSFYRELRSLFRLRHEHIVRLLTLTECAGQARYLVLEYCGGGSLRQALRAARQAGQTCPPARARDLARQVAAGLAWAHRHRLVHRDLKPENVLFAREADGPFGGTAPVKLADFGLARSQPAAAEDGALRPLSGSPAYMAPEQFTGTFTAASDLYALGVVLFELLHGRPPFDGAPEALAQAHLHAPPPIDAAAAGDLIDLLTALLAKAPGALTPAPAGARGHGRCLGVAAFDLVAAAAPDGGPAFVIGSPVGLVPWGGAANPLAGLIPLPGLTGLYPGGPDLWLTQGRHVWRWPPAGSPTPVWEAPDPIAALAPARDGLRWAAVTGGILAEWAAADPAAACWSLPVPPGARPWLVRLPDGRLALAVDRTLMLVDGGRVVATLALPARCHRLGFWRPPARLFALLGDGPEMGLYWVDGAAGAVSALDGAAPTACAAAEPGPDGRLLGLAPSGIVTAWDADGAGRTVGRFDAAGARFRALAVAGGRAAALAVRRGAVWLRWFDLG